MEYKPQVNILTKQYRIEENRGTKAATCMANSFVGNVKLHNLLTLFNPF